MMQGNAKGKMSLRLNQKYLPSVVAMSVALTVSVLCSGQTSSQALANPRAPSDDPRVGLKAGLYDAGEAAFGMQRLASLPKPPGFAPGEATAPPTPEPA